MSAIHVSPIDGDNALLVNGFRITFAIVKKYDGGNAIVYLVWRKGSHLETYKSLQEAVEWCSD